MATKSKDLPENRLARLKLQRGDILASLALAREAHDNARARRAAIRPADFETNQGAALEKAEMDGDKAEAGAERNVRILEGHLTRVEEELHQAVLEDARSGVQNNIAAAKLTEPVLRDGIAALVAKLSQPGAITDSIALLREADAGQVECCNELTAAGEPTQPQRSELVLALPSLIDRSPGAIGTLRTAANIAQFIADEPARAEQRRQEQAERAEAERRRFQAEALQGRHGAAAQRQAEVEHRAWAASFYGGGVAALCGADPEVAGYQAYRSLNEAAEEA